MIFLVVRYAGKVRICDGNGEVVEVTCKASHLGHILQVSPQRPSLQCCNARESSTWLSIAIIERTHAIPITGVKLSRTDRARHHL